MSRLKLDDFFDDLDNANDKTNSRGKTSTVNHDLDDSWLTSKPIKPAVNSQLKRQDTHDDDLDADDGWSPAVNSYKPSFGGGGGASGTSTLNSTLKGTDTIQRIIDQPRPPTASGAGKFDDIFGSSPPKSSILGDTAKAKKAVTFDDHELIRPSTAPSQNQAKPSVLSSLRTALDPIPTSPGKKNTNDSDWLGLRNESTEDDEDYEPIPPKPAPKIEPVVTTVAKKPPITSTVSQPTPAPVVETKKKSLLDSLFEQDKEELNKNTPIIVATPTAPVIKPSSSSWLDDIPSATPKRPSTAGAIRTSDTTSPTRNPVKSLSDTKTDFELSFKDPVFPIDSNNTKSNSSGVNLDLKRLEFENNELKVTIDHMKRQHEMEVSMLDEGYKHRIEYIEKSCERREARLKEENEHLLRQLNDRTKQYDNEKAALLLDYQRRLEDLQRDRTNELENLRSLQRQTVDHLRREHEQTVQRLKELQREEISTAMDVTTHTRAFGSVIDHMEQNAKNIDDLRLKLESKHHSVLTEKEIETRAKEQQLRTYEERLQMQTADFERERKNLQELISRLEVHLADQTKLVEEERWKALQAQKRMEAMQDALNGEQRLYMEKLARDRAEIQRSKEQLLEDQRIALHGIHESRSQLAEERAKVEALQKTFQEQKHRDLLQNATIEAESRAQQKLAAEQLARLDKRDQELQQREEALILEKRSINEQKQRLENEQSTVKFEHEELKMKLHDLELTKEQMRKEKERLSQMYFELHALDGKNTGRLQQLQKSVQNLRQHEERLNEQYTRMSHDGTLTQTGRSRKPPLPIDSGFSTMQLASRTAVLPAPTATMTSQQAIEDSALLRALRMNALNDQIYLEDEMSFLHSLKASPHPRSSRSSSLSNLHRLAQSTL